MIYAKQNIFNLTLFPFGAFCASCGCVASIIVECLWRLFILNIISFVDNSETYIVWSKKDNFIIDLRLHELNPQNMEPRDEYQNGIDEGLYYVFLNIKNVQRYWNKVNKTM